ncbi:hypothetical protein P3T27_006897 [Kitasatospora sp. MAA19]|uniref:hypothetical protein n=1 Tax=Kitasatospora sp. MAA19 TaxID=3035090 RepID=UPI002475D635|nr:hypothetical protein [Kitasatospora sp. MAA19]MDH6710148.1 hypothetical protein [Kitasatospora sp. MAA19]
MPQGGSNSQFYMERLPTDIGSIGAFAMGELNEKHLAPKAELIRDAARAQPKPYEDMWRFLSMCLPENLRHIHPSRWKKLIQISADDAVSLTWAPSPEVITALLEISSSDDRVEILEAHRDEIQADVITSLDKVAHPHLKNAVRLLRAAVRASGSGHFEAAQALAANVLETLMTSHGNSWVRQAFPEFRPSGSGHYRTLIEVLTSDMEWRHRSVDDLVRFLVVVGLGDVFGPDDVQLTFNRHLAAHRASEYSYQPHFALSALLLTHGLLRALDADMTPPEQRALPWGW